MRKIFATMLICVMLFSFTGCSDKTLEYDDDKINIVATIFPLYDFARQIAGDKAELTLLLQHGVEAHSYEPTVQDVLKIKECDLFLTLGTNAEPWADAIINDDSKNVNALIAMDYAFLKEEEHEHSHSHESVRYDQHIWTSLENSKKIAEAICEELCRIDEENAQFYKENTQNYLSDISKLDESFEELVKEHKGETIVFADRFPFAYFVEEYGLEYFAAYPGCSAESEPGAAQVTKLIDLVKDKNIPVVFYTETSNLQLPEAVCEETGAVAKLFHSCHTVSKEGLSEGITYLDIMKKNYEALKCALN